MAVGFGIVGATANTTGRTTTATAQTTDQIGPVGQVLATITHGAVQEVSEDGYQDGAWTNAAINGQTSAAGGAGVVTSHSLIEAAADYHKTAKTTRIPLVQPS